MESRPGEETAPQDFQTREEAREFLDGVYARMEEEGERLPHEISTGLARNRENGRYVVSLLVRTGYDASDFKAKYLSGVAINEAEIGVVRAQPGAGSATAY